ncbi:hypothetical protein ACO2Q9_13110 [Variovorax sp. VNK109]|uniref:hypothetical protein n=1 Tax=Variovorax sp. VNK109 TaxID=3400919 RepID=UPI003BFE0A41
MRLNRPNQKTAAVATDAMGFRVSHHGAREFCFAEYTSRGDASVLLGNSVAFGVGASSDEASLASQLALISGRPWFNLSSRASNIMQDVMSLLLLGASQHHDIVLMSGVNDLLFALHFESADPHFPVFWGNDQFSKLNEISAIEPHDRRLKLSLDERYAHALASIDRAFLLLARFAVNRESRILFALQPLLAWMDKPLHVNEAAMCERWDLVSSGFRATHRPEVIVPWKSRFALDISALCRKHQIDFLDLNVQPSLLTGEHLFVDRIHLTDRGQRIVAALVLDALDSSR